MNFGTFDSADSGFAASDLLVPRKVPKSVVPESTIPPREPEFLTPPKFYRFGWAQLLRTLFSFYPLHLKNISASLFADVPVRSPRFAAGPMAASVVLHLVAYSLLPFVLQFVPRNYADENVRPRTEVIYYHVPKKGPLPPLPKLSPFGPGSNPGSGTAPLQLSARGATATLGNLFAISRPHLADNNHQTVLQPNTPPNLRIKTDLKLPNLLISQERPARPHIEYPANNTRPLQPKHTKINADPPKLSAAQRSESTRGFAPSVPTTEARFPVPIGNTSAPVVPTAKGEDLSAAPSFTASGAISDGSDQFSGVPVATTRLGAPISGGSAPIVPSASKAGDVADAPTFGGVANNGQEILALSTEPGGPADVVALPPGNRYGQFAIAPGASGRGSPGGVEGGSAHGGVGGTDGGGNDSSVGKGTYGGGGDSSGSGFISMRGSGTAGSALADPGPVAMAQQLVYALPVSTLMRHNRLVVSAGPIGGGGSNVYGQLPCGKIYTVFLPTGGKPWPLQFCQKTDARFTSENKARTAVVQVEPPLVPPETTENYDFKRLPLPPEKAHKSIVLRGAINESGTVEDLQIHQGLLPAMDAAAKLAFSQWKFKPAMRSGKPVKVEILLAVPAD